MFKGTIKGEKMEEKFKEFLINLGLNTETNEYDNRLWTVKEWWGLWGVIYFKMGYESKEGETK
jgi:hypothetical protein